MVLNFSFLESVEYIIKNEKNIDRIWLGICNELAKKHSMQIVGMGGEMDKGKAHLLSISFEKTKNITKCQGRLIIIDCVKQVLSDVNQSEQLKPLLSNNPFTEENIAIVIFFKDKKNGRILHPYQNTLSFYKGEISYATVGKENIYQYKTQEFETFEEALQKVHCNE